MTPKEKAKELFDKFNKIKHSVSTHVQKERAKQCALIAVDEIIDAIDKSLIDSDIEFFKQVKQEIEKL